MAERSLDRDRVYLDGGWARPAGEGRIEVVEPATEQVLATIPAGTSADVDRAVKGARDAFPGWAALPIRERASYLSRIGAGLAARGDELARLITREMGTPLRTSRAIQATLPVTVLDQTAQLALEWQVEERLGSSLVVREPVGVVGAITPWNYPLHQVTAKLAPALAAGCTVVLKPSEVAPLCAYLLFDVIHEVGLPPGVVSLVPGTGTEVGEALASHPGVDMISFTGSTRAGRRVSALAAETVKRVALELGGKSANVLLPDADLDKAVKVGIGNAFLNAGQTCTAWTRMLVPRRQHEEVVALAVKAAAGYAPGDPLADGTRLGPLVSAAQRDRVRGLIGLGEQEGARLVAGGADAPEGLPTGFYVRPTVFADVRTEMTIAQEEIFGPVLSVLPYDDEQDALRIANDTPYGLSGAVWSKDQDHAVSFARGMRTGQVDINGGRFNPLAPFGGYKQSGNGRELGRYGLEEFCETKSLQL